MDGTLLDSMRTWNQAPRVYLKKLGIESEESLGENLFALTIADAAGYVKEHFRLPYSVEEVVKGINQVVKDFYLTEAQLKSGALELLEYIKEKEIPMVVGTSTDRDCIEAAFNRLDLNKFFGRLFTCTEVGASKSEPNLFREAMAFMGTDEASTLVVEDGLYSMRTARKLGMQIAGVYDYISRHDQEGIKEIADFYVAEGESLWKLRDVIGCSDEGSGRS